MPSLCCIERLTAIRAVQSENGIEGQRPIATKLICTLGPKCCTVPVFEKLLQHGMRGVRIDLTWPSLTMDWARQAIQNLHEAEDLVNAMSATIVTTKGPVLRIADAPEDRDVHYKAHTTVTLRRQEQLTDVTEDCVPVRSIMPFTKANVTIGGPISITQYLASGDDNSTLDLQVQSVSDDEIVCEVMRTCVFPARALLLLHDAATFTELPILCDHDKACLKELAPVGIEYVCLSYCRTADDVREAREFLHSIDAGGIKVIAEISTAVAARNGKYIIQEADAVMIERGTLGLELPAEKVFGVQKSLLRAANLAGKAAIVTRVVDSMVTAPRPTRAEATDVANLVLDGADGIVLGAETFRGEDPVNATATVQGICMQAERCYDSQDFYTQLMDEYGGFREAKLSKSEAIASSAVRATSKLGATLIMAFTKTGRTPALIAKYRAPVPIMAVIAKSEDKRYDATLVARQCALVRGVVPQLALPSCIGAMATDGSTTDWALRKAKHLGLAKEGDRIVVSQCPRILPDGKFEEAAVVKFVVVGDENTQARQLSKCGSLMDMGSVSMMLPASLKL